MKVIINADDPQSRRRALDCAEAFAADYPDRVGRRQCCVYTYNYKAPARAFVAYRTEAGAIVVRQDGAS